MIFFKYVSSIKMHHLDDELVPFQLPHFNVRQIGGDDVGGLAGAVVVGVDPTMLHHYPKSDYYLQT